MQDGKFASQKKFYNDIPSVIVCLINLTAKELVTFFILLENLKQDSWLLDVWLMRYGQFLHLWKIYIQKDINDKSKTRQPLK